MFKKFIITIFSFFIFFYAAIALSSDLKIVYVDIDKVINQSNAGKNISTQLEAINNNNISKYKKDEKKLADEEKNLVKQKNILSNGDFEKKVKLLKKNINIYKKNINVSRKELEAKRVEGTTKILDILNPILSDYSSKNSISLIIQKKNIVIGQSELDITSQILELLNSKIKTVKLN